ncbi:GNAT family N-acetyltransferase [Sphingomonas sp.]|uniref:GNAT family N-acetyltransferase n=1 Tax=Sphingomonas sp. TaxID=28214 RepID=UPI0025FAECC4|nr:GNAT family N-acetyltransferase [Sphingomonas sp.]
MNIQIREATPEDAEALIPLIELLRHKVTAEGVRQRIEQIASHDCPQLVADDNGTVVGLCGLHVMTALHREKPVGRITILVVAEHLRGRGIGEKLVAAAEQRLRAAGCGMIELTSNDWLVEAHQFYAKLGYQQTSKRFAKAL